MPRKPPPGSPPPGSTPSEPPPPDRPDRDDEPAAASIRASAQQIWLAGLGAFAKAQQGGGRVFDGLVSEGRELQGRLREAGESRLGGIAELLGGKVGLLAESLSRQTAGTRDRLEQAVEERVARALAGLGVPMRGDAEALIARIEALETAVRALAGAREGSPARSRAARPAQGRAAAATPPRTGRGRAAAPAPAAAPAKPRAARKPGRTTGSGG